FLRAARRLRASFPGSVSSQFVCPARSNFVPRILTVDDSVAMRQMVEVTLTSAGYDVQQAENGREALDIANTQSFDLVITDVNMPQMDGLTLVRNLRGLPSYKHTPLLVLTTENTPERK